MLQRSYVLLIFVFIFSKAICAQEVDSSKSGGFFPLPVVYYTPETKFGFGAVALYSFRFKNESKSSRNSQIQFGGAYTQEDQLLFYMPFQMYKKNNDYLAFGELGYYRYSYKFFGIGNNVSKDYEEIYNVNFPRIRLNALKLLKPNFYLGLRYWFDKYDIVNTEEGALLDDNAVVGSSGGIVSSLGLIGIYDTRDNYNYPTEGSFLTVLMLPNLNAFGSDFEYTRFSIDYVKFFNINTKNVFTINAFGVSILGAAPFNELAFIGGRGKMRGYYEGQFRGRNLTMLQSEYRRTLFWKVGFVAFIGTGVVAHEIDQLELNNLQITGGAGLRFQLDPEEKINIRLDYGIGERGNSGIYLTIGEAF
jgi:outer membrane protein assembly factor BamA